jgi:ribonucleoside-diphosphate reductase alpha chain
LDDRPGFGRAVVKPGLDVDFRTGDGSVAAQDELGLDGATLEGASPAEGRTAMSLNTQDSGTEALVAAVAAAAASAPAPEKENSRTVRARRFGIVTDESRDALLTAFGKDTLDDRYLLPGEKYQDLFARVADAYADDEAHAQRLYDYISKLWFMPATPVLSNGGTGRGCRSRATSIRWTTAWKASSPPGTRTSGSPAGAAASAPTGARCAASASVGLNGKTSGIIPFVRVMDSLTLAISQGSLRRGSAAAYLDVSHPEIEEFLEIRKTSGDFNRKALNLHHGVLLTDEFMEAVRDGAEFALRSPKDGSVRGKVDARSLFQKLVEVRLATGEPYLVFSDTVNRMMPKHHRDLGLKVSTSNLCSEITLPTGRDHLGNDRTAVCCLSSLNLETWDQWHGDKHFVEDVLRFLDNVLQDYIDRAPTEMARAKYSAMRERSVGMGVMGFHSFLQQKGIAFESAMAKAWNLKMFRHIAAKADEASLLLAQERGPCPDAADMGVMQRFSCKMAIAPTASISIICGGTSACIEPIPANIYTHKTLSGSFVVENPYLKALLQQKSKDSANVWNSILENGGSVQHLDFLSRRKRRCTRPASRSTSAGCSNSRRTAPRSSIRRSRSTSISRPTSTSGT